MEVSLTSVVTKQEEAPLTPPHSHPINTIKQHIRLRTQHLFLLHAHNHTIIKPEPLLPLPRLAILTTTGGAVYCGWLILFARATVVEAIDLVRNRGNSGDNFTNTTFDPDRYETIADPDTSD